MAVQTETESKFVQFCREDSATTQQAHADLLLKGGWRYLGPVNNNGMNCTNTLWAR
jgi:hypothetical protein